MRISDWSSDVCSSDLLQRPKRETLSIDEEPVEVGAVGLQVIECEDWAEDLLHVTDMLANADQCAGLCLDIGGGREMVGMGVGFQHHGDAPALVLRHRQYPVGRAGIDLAAGQVEIKHGVDRKSTRLNSSH